jgi:hypothetical protein
LPIDRVRGSDVSLVRYDEEDADEDEDQLAWGASPSRTSSANRSRGDSQLGHDQPGSVAQAGYEDEAGLRYGSVPEPSTLRILEASPLPGPDDDPRPAPRSRPVAPSRLAEQGAPAAATPAPSAQSTVIRFEPMPVHDATQVEPDERATHGGTARDIGDLPAVPPHLRERIDPPVNAVERPPPASGPLSSGNSRSRSQPSPAPPTGVDSHGWRVR